MMEFIPLRNLYLSNSGGHESRFLTFFSNNLQIIPNLSYSHNSGRQNQLEQEEIPQIYPICFDFMDPCNDPNFFILTTVCHCPYSAEPSYERKSRILIEPLLRKSNYTNKLRDIFNGTWP